MSKPLPLAPYTDTASFYIGRRLKTNPDATRFSGAALGHRPATGIECREAGWKGDASSVVPWSLSEEPFSHGSWGIVTEVRGLTTVNALFLWKSRGRIVAATFTDLHCSNFVTSRGGPPLIGESESLSGVHSAAPKAAAPAAAPATDADAALDAIRKLLGASAAPAVDADEVERLTDAAVSRHIDELRREMAPMLDVVSRMKSDPIVRGKVAVAAVASKNPIVDYLSSYYQAGFACPSNVCLAAPPSIGKTFAFRQLGKSYDVYLEHGCTDDIDEVSTLLGSTAPNPAGGFVVFDGVLTQAVRAASEGKTVLLLFDEVFRLGKTPSEYLLTFLTGVKLPDGTKVYRLRTRRIMPDGTLEVIECKATHLHLAAATNLGAKSPVEAFWDRWEHKRLPFDEASVRATAMTFAEHYGVTNPSELADKFAAGVAASRAAVADGSLKYPLSFRALENAAEMACRFVPTPDAASVLTLIANAVSDRCAHWGVDSGETDPASLTAVSIVRLALGVK